MKTVRYEASKNHIADLTIPNKAPVSELIKESEQMMYKDKADFYKDSPFERRHAEKA
ncbi:MAG: hypothetical protein K5925_04120 [Bacilli bacterium]|nr:hypothetical protein [Bacilli bacterium]